MKEFKVALITYIVEHDEGIYYDNAESLVIETPLFRATLDHGRLQFLLKEHFDDPSAAADAIRPFVEAWEGKARQERPEEGFRLEFEEAQIMVLRPEPGTPQRVRVGQAVETDIALPIGGAKVSYPEPPDWGDLLAEGSPHQWGSGGARQPQGPPWSFPATLGPATTPEKNPNSEGNAWGGDSYWGSPGQGGEREAPSPELAETVARAVTVLEEISDALNGPDAKALDAQIGEAKSSTAGIGHNNPPPDLEEARAVVEQSLEALAEEAPNVERLLTVRAALKWLGERFTTFADALASSLGKAARPALLIYLATELPKVAEFVEKVISMLR